MTGKVILSFQIVKKVLSLIQNFYLLCGSAVRFKAEVVALLKISLLFYQFFDPFPAGTLNLYQVQSRLQLPEVKLHFPVFGIQDVSLQ